MKIFKVNAQSDFALLCELIKPHKIGQKIMSQKSKLHFFFIKDIKNAAVNILKQDALRVGAELVSHKEVILDGLSLSNALLIATKEQLLKLAEKESKQDFNLKQLAVFLKKDFNKPKKAELMGVLNINDDSFNESSRVKKEDFEARLEALLALEPSYIDIGAVSSRPGSVYCGREEEFKRLKPVLDLIASKDYTQRAIFSLDSFDEYCLEYALERGFKLINDIQGFKNVKLAKLALKYKARYVLMHMQNAPHNMQDNPHYEDLLFELDSFFGQKLENLGELGLEDVILDVGIGFGKSPQHNLILLKNLEHFLHFNKPLLVGASRKSVIHAYFKSEVKDRLAGSLYLHLKAFENGASIIRTHDIYEHKQLFALDEAMNEVGL